MTSISFDVLFPLTCFYWLLLKVMCGSALVKLTVQTRIRKAERIMCLVAKCGGFQLCFSNLGQTKGQALALLQSGTIAC